MRDNILVTGGTSGIGKYFMENYPQYKIQNVKNIINIHSWADNKDYINGFVHFAGISTTKPVSMFDMAEFKNIMYVNIGLALEIIKYITKKQYSENLSIILISSVAALKGDSCISMYAASKGAIISLTKSLAVELAPKGITVNCISPGHIADTRMSNENELKMGDSFQKIKDKHLLGIGQKKDVCDCVDYILKSNWITGQNFVIDGGYTA